MKRWPIASLEDFFVKKRESVDPSKFSNEIFDLYSIPAHDVGQPEVLAGKEIGSTKQVVYPNDILLSRIVPHIRRVWVVGADQGKRLIASGEWIIFRSSQLNSSFLRYFLLGDPFHSKFMQTVSGVGGSLLRAKTSEVAKFKIPVPSLEEQERIVELLDEADKLRKLRAQADYRTADLIPALFHGMFGDPAKESEKWPMTTLAQVCQFIGGSSLPSGVPFIGQPDGLLLLKVGDMNASGNETFISASREWIDSGSVTYSRAARGTIVIPKRGGAIATNKKRMLLRDALLDPNLMGIYANDQRVTLDYLFEWFRLFDLTRITSGSIVPQLNKQDLAPLRIAVPPLSLQKEFVHRVAEIREMETVQSASRKGLGSLFQSMLHRAFEGEL